MVTEQVHEGWWDHHDEFQLVVPGTTADDAYRATKVTPGPLAVPELSLDDPPVDELAPRATEVDGPPPAWWSVFDDNRFAQPGSPGPDRAGRGSTTPPLAVPELPLARVAPWPAPASTDEAMPPGAEHAGWWLASDGRWYPVAPVPATDLRPVGTTASHGPRRGLRVLAAVGAACAVVGLGFVVGTALAPTPGPTVRESAPTSPGASAVPTTGSPANTLRPADPAPKGSTPTTVAPAPAAAPAPTPTPTPTTPAQVSPPPPQATSGVVFDYESAAIPTTVDKLASDPAGGAAQRVVFTGVIAAFVLDDAGGAVAMYVSTPGAPSPVVLVQLSPYDDVTQITTGDTVVIWGDATGRVSFANTVGQPTDVTNVDQVYLADRTSGYQDTGDPAPA